MDICWFSIKNNHVQEEGLATWTNYDPEETENYPRKLSENSGEHPQESADVDSRGPAE